MSEFRRLLTRSWLFCCVALPLGLSAQAGAAQQTIYPTLKESVPIISTAGTASVDVIPDLATLFLGVETERPNAADAARENTRAVQAVVNEIKAQGIEEKDIKTVSITLAPVYDETTDANGRTKRTLRGYNARNALSVRLRDVKKAGALASQLMAKGANSLDGIEFDYSQKEAKYEGLRIDAVRDALRKANSYVSGLGIKLGRVLEIATQPPGPIPVAMSPRMTAAASRQADAAAAVPIEPGVQTLRTEVQVTWELAQ